MNGKVRLRGAPSLQTDSIPHRKRIHDLVEGNERRDLDPQAGVRPRSRSVEHGADRREDAGDEHPARMPRRT